jgi:hypothetical protein
MELSVELERLQIMLQQYLQYRALTAPPAIPGRHLDEDTLSVFVEGRLSEREGAPLINHLVACAACRHSTAELIRLNDALEPETAPQTFAEPLPEPGIFQRFLSNVRERAPSMSFDSGSVFAYHETDAPNGDSPRAPDDSGSNH